MTMSHSSHGKPTNHLADDNTLYPVFTKVVLSLCNPPAVIPNTFVILDLMSLFGDICLSYSNCPAQLSPKMTEQENRDKK